MKEFQKRNQLIQEKKNASEGSTVYLGDIESAMKPAQLGTGIALVFVLSGVVFLVSSVGTYARSKRSPNNKQNKSEMATPRKPSD